MLLVPQIAPQVSTLIRIKVNSIAIKHPITPLASVAFFLIANPCFVNTNSTRNIPLKLSYVSVFLLLVTRNIDSVSMAFIHHKEASVNFIWLAPDAESVFLILFETTLVEILIRPSVATLAVVSAILEIA